MAQKGYKIPDDVLENVFDFWCNNDRHVANTGKHFDIARQTIAYLIKKHKWQNRYKKIQSSVERHTDKTIAQGIADNLGYVRALKKKVLLRLLEKNFKLDGTISEVIKLMEYEDKLLGIAPDETEAPSTLIFNIINMMSTDEQKQLDTNLEIFYGNGKPMDPQKRVPQISASTKVESGAVSSSNGEGHDS